MIFYFSGQVPMTRKPSADDEDVLHFLTHAGSFDRLICMVYEKESAAVMKNLKLTEEKHGFGQCKRPRRRS